MQQLASLLCIRKLLIGDFAQREITYFQYLRLQGCCLRICAVSKDRVFTWEDFLSFLSDHHYYANSNIVG